MKQYLVTALVVLAFAGAALAGDTEVAKLEKQVKSLWKGQTILEKRLNRLEREQTETNKRLLDLLRAVEICRRHELPSSCLNRLK